VRAFYFYLGCILVGAAFLRLRALDRQRLPVLRRLHVLQFIVLATAWNILGGYCGYVNFARLRSFAAGAYSSVALHKLGANIDRYFPEQLAGFVKLLMPFKRSDADHHRRHRLRPDRARHRLSDGCGCAARSSPSRRWRWPSCCKP